MKNYSLYIATVLFAFLSCKKDSAIDDAQLTSQQSSKTGNYHNPGFSSYYRYNGSDYSQPITPDAANEMIQSYLTSIKYPDNDSSLRSLKFDADSLRNYLNDTTNGKIVTLKFIVAHNQSYTQDNYGRPAGLNGNAITLVVVGLDENDNYIYNRNNQVYDHFQPCPSNCGDEGALLSQ